MQYNAELYQNTEELYKALIYKIAYYNEDNINSYPKHKKFESDVRIKFFGDWQDKTMKLFKPKLWGFEKSQQAYFDTLYLEYLVKINNVATDTFWEPASALGFFGCFKQDSVLYHVITNEKKMDLVLYNLLKQVNDDIDFMDFRDEFQKTEANCEKRKVMEINFNGGSFWNRIN